MKNLLTGYLITVLALAVTDGAGAIIGAAAENLRVSINLNTAKKQIQINQLAASTERQEDTRAIGFTYTVEEDDGNDD